MISGFDFSTADVEPTNISSGLIPASISTPLKTYSSPIGGSLGILGMNYFKGESFDCSNWYGLGF